MSAITIFLQHKLSDDCALSQDIGLLCYFSISLPAVMYRFLLKYISRDELDVLARGNGGVADIREAVAGYSELSPLYGFLRFRRRSVLVRYVPKDTSRLLQGTMPRRTDAPALCLPWS